MRIKLKGEYMSIQIDSFHKILALLDIIHPAGRFEKREFTRENADQMLEAMFFFLDSLFKAENAQMKKNLFFPENRELFSGNRLTLIENTILFLQSFQTQVFNFSRNERQTFVFVLENIHDYFRSQPDGDEKEKKSHFQDYRYWIENFLKILDQKLNGTLEIKVDYQSNPDESATEPSLRYPLFSNSMIKLELSPFMLLHGERAIWLTDIQEQSFIYRSQQDPNTLPFFLHSAWPPFLEFLLANLAFGSIDRITDSFEKFHPIMYKKSQIIRKAMQLFRQGLHEESQQLLLGIEIEPLNMPLLQLVVVQNLLARNRENEAKRAIQKFLLHYPQYAEGHEIMGDLYGKEENWELALGFYEKALILNQKQTISEKIKKTRDALEKGKAKAETQKSDLLFNISEQVLQKDIHLLPRERETRQMMEILLSPSKRNVLLIGDRGVGKSTIIRLLAQKLMLDEIPDIIREKKIKEVNFVSLLTGSKYRGQFEEKVLRFFQDFRLQNSILVLEDIHLMMSTSAARGTSLDLVNILKGFLRENAFQVIATTDYEEFKNTLEKDNSLLGHFQKLLIPELGLDETETILKAKAAELAESQQIIVPTHLIKEIVETAKRDLRERKLPDAAIMLLERTAAKVSLKHHLDQTQPLTIDETEIREVLVDFLNIPESNLSISWKHRLQVLTANMKARIIGQTDAIERISSSIATAKIGLDIKKNRPKGVFLLIGPTGVGKTETALALTEALFGTQDYLIRIDMSEYMERFTYSRFVGAAPGYVGYYDSNQLTDKVRQNPFSVILLDEIEKADNQLLNIFLQVFDAGRLTDARGNIVDFSNSTIIMTSNIGTSLFSKANMGYHGSLEGSQVSRPTLIKALKRYFSPEFLNRIDEIVVFHHLSMEHVHRIIEMQLAEVKKDMEKLGKELIVQEDVVTWIAKAGYSLEYGARNLARTIKKELLEKIAVLYLGKDWEEFRYIHCSIGTKGIELTMEPFAPAIAPVTMASEETNR